MALRLTWELFEAFGGRKKAGLLSIFVDVKTGQLHPLPLKVEHVAFAARLLGTTVEAIKQKPEMAMHLVNSNIVVENGEIVEVFTGISGLELHCNVKHYIADLKKAHGIIWVFINDGEIAVGKIRVNKIVDTFAIY